MNFFNQKKKKSFSTLAELTKDLKKSNDFVETFIPQSNQGYFLSYYQTIIDSNILHDDVIEKLQETTLSSLEQIKQAVPIEEIKITSDLNTIKQKLMLGSLMIRFSEQDEECALINIAMKEKRQIAIPEVEYSVIGPKESFVEDINININLIRTRLPTTDFKVETCHVGELSKTQVAVLYIEGICNQENVNTALQRIKSIKIDQILDSAYISQLISDNSRSPFPQSRDTERPDRVAASLAEGGIAILVDRSSFALIVPTTLIEFFSSIEDNYIHWLLASSFRLIRVGSVILSILATPIYVAVITYHYVLIPKELLVTLVASRQGVPLPPILEALILELAIELLREAGARLPTKIGQTIGIVGGIVIGTASVEAGLTSNVLLIIVAIAALGSFTTPVYKMGNTIRILRFPLLIAAFLYGLPGIIFSLCFIMIHLIDLSSLGRPYLEPIYPPRGNDFKDTFIRLPFSFQSKRPIMLQTEKTIRFNQKKAKQKKDIDD